VSTQSQSAQPTRSSQSIAIEHVRLETHKQFLDVKKQRLRHWFRRCAPNSLRACSEEIPMTPLSSWNPWQTFRTLVRDHGQLLRVAGKTRNALQYEIGNPLAASSMTRHTLAAELYAPLRVVLYETEEGAGVCEYDLPSSLIDDRVAEETGSRARSGAPERRKLKCLTNWLDPALTVRVVRRRRSGRRYVALNA